MKAKVKYQGQDLYMHVAFAVEATRLASDIGDTSGFLLPALRSVATAKASSQLVALV